MRANEFINEGAFDRMKSAVGAAKQKASAFAASPTGQQIGSNLSAVGDWAKAKAYTNLGGLGGKSGAGAAARQSFLSKFVSDYNRYMMSAKQGGMEQPSMQEYVESYINKYKWNASPEQVAKIVTASAGDVNKLANNMFTLASDQSYDEFGRTGGQGGGFRRQSTKDADADEGQPSAMGQKIANNVGMMRDKRDLTVVAKAAMNRLDRVNPAAYKELRQEVITGTNI